MTPQSLEISQGEEFAGLEPCTLKVVAEDRQRGHPPPPESKWVVLALFSFPSGLYFGSELREDRHKGFKISKTLSTVVPTGMTFGYAFTGQM